MTSSQKAYRKRRRGYEKGENNLVTFSLRNIGLLWNSDICGGGGGCRAFDHLRERIGAPVLFVNKSGYDIICVQEDFGYHDTLAATMTDYPYQTYTSGGVPVGDGLNVFSKYRLYP